MVISTTPLELMFMLTIPGKPGATCDGYSRRELIRVGGAFIAADLA